MLSVLLVVVEVWVEVGVSSELVVGGVVGSLPLSLEVVVVQLSE